MSTEDYVDQLIARYPAVFQGQEPAAGCSVPEGWRQIVEDLCRDFTQVLQCSPGHRLQMLQVKEKFGALRVYFSLDGDQDLVADLQDLDGHIHLVQKAEGPAVMDELRALVDGARRRSQQACQKCGEPGSQRNRRGWLAVLCDRHSTSE